MLFKGLFKKLFNYLLIIFLALAIFSLLFFINQLFKVTQIIVETGNNLQIKGLLILKNKNIFLLSDNKIRNQLIESNSWIKSVQIIKIYPNKLIIKCIFYSPIVYLKVNPGYVLLSNNGRILDKQIQNYKNLPVINYYQKFNYYSLTSGQFLDWKDIRVSLYFLIKTNKFNIKVNSIDINGFNMIVFNLDQGSILFSYEKDKEKQIYELQRIIRQFKLEGTTFKKIDLRFDKPIITL